MATVVTIQTIEYDLGVLERVARGYPKTVCQRSGLSDAIQSARQAIERAEKTSATAVKAAQDGKPGCEIREKQERAAQKAQAANVAVQAAWVIVKPKEEGSQRPIGVELIGWCAAVTGLHIKSLKGLEAEANFGEWAGQDRELSRLYQAVRDGVKSADEHTGDADQRYALVKRNFGRLQVLQAHWKRLCEAGGPAIAVQIPVASVATAEVTAIPA